MTINSRIKELRKEHGWSQAELAERVGVGRLAISGMEQGDRTISIEEAQALAQVFGVSLLALLGEEVQAEEEGVELRFEVTVKLLPSREEKLTPQEIEERVMNPPREPYEDAVKRVFGKSPGVKASRIIGKDKNLDKTTIKGMSRNPKRTTSKRRTKR
jgi:putative transcriptional regulator